MEQTTIRPTTRASKLLPFDKEVMLLPIGDLHYPAPGCDLERFQRHISWGLSQGAYFLGMGDFMDLASPSSRFAVGSSGAYDHVSQALSFANQTYLEQLQRILYPTRGRWLGFLSGHHFWIDDSGQTSDQALATFLDASFLGTCAWPITIDFGGPTCTIFAHHGSGGGRSVGAALRYLTSNAVPTFQADIYLIGHLHKKEATKMPYLQKEGGYVNRVVACTGSFLHGYVRNSLYEGRPQGGYVEKALLPPSALGGIVLYIRPREDGSVDVDVSL